MSTDPQPPASSIDYQTLTRERWDERAPIHASSPTYNLAHLIASPAALSDALTFDLPRLPPLTGKSIAHLQCHIGSDALSLARLGAQRVVGLDFSGASVREARALAGKAAGGEKCEFVEGDVYDSVGLLGERAFDVVFVNVGSLAWLLDVRRWAKVVAGLMRSGGGEFFMREVHPSLLAVEGGEGGRLAVEYPYFEVVEPLVTNSSWTYVKTEEGGEVPRVRKCVEWNHGLGEIVSALLGEGLRITMLVEHRSVPYEAVRGHMVEIGGGEWALKEGRDRLPLSFTLRAVKD